MSLSSTLSGFAERLSAFIRSVGQLNAPAQEGQFDELARELFGLQFKENVAYRQFCEGRHLRPESITHWRQIPAVPTAAFKELDLSCLAPPDRTHAFHSSGTTEQRPSRHFHNRQSLTIYELSLLEWFKTNLLTDRLGGGAQKMPMLCLTPPPESVPHSSLVHMFATVGQRFASRAMFLARLGGDGSWLLDQELATAQLQQAALSGEPVLLSGTAFSLVHLLDWLSERDQRFKLPQGSRVMETGGYKGRSRYMPKKQLHGLITRQLGVSSAQIVCEYGMAELSSQAYAPTQDGTSRNFHFPPWAGVQIISPETGCETAEGEAGLIRVFDLANVFSVLAIQTEDLGIPRCDGFELIGRAAEAEPRGCSLMAG